MELQFVVPLRRARLAMQELRPASTWKTPRGPTCAKPPFAGKDHTDA
jgi:hypothetical protein